MAEFTDQMNRTIQLDATPARIVSLVPSQTQLLHYLGLEKEVVGITKFCIHPEEWFRSKQRVGGTKSVKPEVVRELQPDLIIGNKEENQRENIESLEGIAPIWMSDIFTLDDAFEMMDAIGEMTDREEKISELKSDITEGFEKLAAEVQSFASTGKKVLYFIWRDPDMVSGRNTFVDHMLERCGLINATEEERYPIVGQEHDTDFIFLSSEPYPFKEQHLAEFKEKYPKAKIVLVDGEMFSWYGSKLKDAPDYFIQLLKSISD